MERSHAQYLERGTGSVERWRGEPLDVLREQCDEARKLNLRQTAIEKGQTRIQEAEKFARQNDQDISMDNKKCIIIYKERYRHEIDFVRDDIKCYIDIKTYVKGAGAIYRPCYTNRLAFCKDASRNDYDHVFYGLGNFKRRLPYSRAYDKADDDFKYEQTKPLPHVDILFNQIRAANEYLAQQSKSGWPTKFDLGVYYGHNIFNPSDQKIFDTLLPEETGEVLLRKGTDGYKAIAGCDTGNAKWMLAARLGKEISMVMLEKKKKLNEKKGKLETQYHTKYYLTKEILAE
jgi:hypothetical protein